MGISYKGSITLPKGGMKVKKAATNAVDPYWDNVVFMSSFDINTTDAKISSFGADIPRNTTDFKFGGASAELGGNYYVIPKITSWDMFNDFTIEGWFKLPTISTTQNILGNWSAYSGTKGWELSLINGRLEFGYTTNGTDGGTSVYATVAAAANEWFHAAISKSGNEYRLFLNGVRTDTFTGYSNVYSVSPEPIYLGRLLGYNYDHRFNGLMDDLRVTIGVARYDADFDIPTQPYPTSGE